VILSGKISDLKVTEAGESKNVDVTFEKETAAKTALLLNNTQLGPNHISVTSAGGDIDDGAAFTKNTNRDTDEITQEEKPRARILAEYLAQGYVVGDAAIQRALELDQTHGVSARFLTTLNGLDQKIHASDRARATDQTYGLSTRANTFFSGLHSYFEKASNTPTGKKLVKFYEDGQKQVIEVHDEARRLADLKKDEHGGSAYKAAGLERVFGKEKEHPEQTTTTPVPAAGTANPTQINPNDPIPPTQSTDEKTYLA
jgi:hypothetical protein